METVYSALNGQEIREIIKTYLATRVDQTPLLKIANTFHKVKIEGVFQITAFPADVPVPELEFEIEFKAKDIPEDVNAKAEYFLKLRDQIEVANEFLEKYNPEDVADFELDGTVPDQVRMNNNLPVNILKKNESGRTFEEPVASKTFLGKKVEIKK